MEKSSCVKRLKTNVLPDFIGGHPDPNLTYAADLVKEMGRYDRYDSLVVLANRITKKRGLECFARRFLSPALTTRGRRTGCGRLWPGCRSSP